MPPLDYSCVLRLKQDFPAAEFVLNGGIATWHRARTPEHHRSRDAGRAAYHDPYLLAGVDSSVFGEPAPQPTREAVVLKMTEYLQTRRVRASRRVMSFATCLDCFRACAVRGSGAGLSATQTRCNVMVPTYCLCV